jgi:hypothetical protein
MGTEEVEEGKRRKCFEVKNFLDLSWMHIPSVPVATLCYCIGTFIFR